MVSGWTGLPAVLHSGRPHVLSQTWVSASHPVMTLSKAKRSWVWHHGATGKGCWGWFAPLLAACEGKEMSVTMQGGRRLGISSEGM